MKQLNLTNVQEPSEFTTLPAGAYVCVIRKVEDVSDKEYLKVTYDIADGEFKGYYDDIRKNHPDWAWSGAYAKSYKEKALPMFKRFCTAVSKSNGAYVFDGGTVNSDETTLVGKKLGIVLGEEEYYSNSGDKKTRLYVYRECPVDQIASQRVPNKKELNDGDTNNAQVSEFMNIPEGGVEEIPY